MLGRASRARLEAGGWQVADVLVAGGFHPATIIARADRPLRLLFLRDDDDECSARVVFSAARLDRRLVANGTTLIELPPQPRGEVRFTCAMGRYRGRIEFVRDRGPSLLDRLRERGSHLDGRRARLRHQQRRA
jgi:plastocyanin domain-containing protein